MIDSSFVTFVALILSVIYASIYLARRGKTMSWLEQIGLVGLAIYFPFVLGLTLGGIPIDVGATPPTEWRRWANLIPFGTIGPQLAAGLESGLRQLVGNLLILLPLGFGLPVVWQLFRRLTPTLLVGFGVAFGIEISQVIISLIVGVPYRAFDVDDLILNTAGAIIGWVAWRISLGWIQHSSESPTHESLLARSTRRLIEITLISGRDRAHLIPPQSTPPARLRNPALCDEPRGEEVCMPPPSASPPVRCPRVSRFRARS